MLWIPTDLFGAIPSKIENTAPFITTWKTDNPGVSCSSCITIPTTGGGYNYDVDRENDGVYDDFGVSGDIMYDYGTTPDAGMDDGSCQTCNTGMQNEDETVVDCSGTNYSLYNTPCVSPTFITSNIESVYDPGFVKAADLDGDDDLDVIVAISTGLVWYSNDGLGNFNFQENIYTSGAITRGTDVSDLDGDGDMDILWGHNLGIAWSENDGAGGFGPMQFIISNSGIGYDHVFAVDIDSDGDMDVLSKGNLSIVWYENEGAGNFSEEEKYVISNNNPNVNPHLAIFYPEDVDGDGDVDLIAGFQNNTIVLYSNDGNGNFLVGEVINTTESLFTSLQASDLDGDGDLDVLFTSYVNNIIAWFENDGTGGFGDQQLVAYSLGIPNAIASDLDSDGDMDVLNAMYLNENMVVWYENYGNGNFGGQQVIWMDRANYIIAADLDSDYDMDVLSASMTEDKIVWHENICSFVQLNAPNDTTVSGICNVPTADTLLLLNPMDLNDTIFIPSVDSTASNGTILPGTPILNAISVCGGPDTLYRIWRGTFADMTEGEVTQQIIIMQDTMPPVSNFTIDLDTVISCELKDQAFNDWRQSRLFAVNSNLDDCTGILSVNTDMPPSSYVPGPCDTLEVTFTIEDFCGNIRNYEASFITIDTVAPVLQNVPDSILVNCNDVQDYLNDNPPSAVTVFDCQEDLAINYQRDTISIPQGCSGNEFDIRRSWSVTDACGNHTSAVQLIRVRDTIAPTFQIPPDVTVSCADDSDIAFEATPTMQQDNCTSFSNLITELVSETVIAGACDNNYVVERVWRVEDECGNSTSGIQTITVADTLAPVIDLQGDSIFSAFGIETCSDNVISSFEVSSNCGDEPEVSIFFDSLRLGSLKPVPQVLTGNYPNFGISGVFPIGAHALEIHAVDACGNETIEIVPFVVEQPIEDSDICPSVVSVEAQNDGAALTAEALILESFFNNSCLDWTATLDRDIFTTCSDIGTEDVELSITNSVDTFVCVSTVLISDNTSPAISCSDTTITIIDGAQKTVTRDLLQASLTDNCTLTDTIILPGKLSCTDTGDNEVVILAEDASGNIGMCTATVTVINEEVPVAQCRDREVSLNQEGMASLTALDLDDGSYSNCGTLSYTASQLSFSCEDGSAQTVALYVEGENGKADTCTSNVTLKDVYAPNAQCADITVYLGANGQVAIPPASLDGGSEDNCDITGWDSTFPMADCDEVGTHFALLLVSDAAGNTDVCISEITVADTLGSLLTAAITDTTVVLNANCEAVVPDLTGAVMVSGGCNADLGDLSIGQFPTAGTAIPEDTTVVSLFIEGSTADSLEITLSVAPDTIAPELSIYTPWGSLLQQDTLRVSTLDTSCATVTTLELVPFDNCPSADTFAIAAVLTDSLSDASPDFGAVYDADNEQYRFELSAEDGWYAFDFSVTDAFGNAGTASLIVLVQDSISPVAVCEDAEVSVTPTQGSSISFADIGIGSTDNCGLMDITLSQTQFTCADAGPQPVVLTLTDQFGNSSECTATVTVVNALQGLPCDDGDDCTINDRYLIDCGCAGDLLDTNDNGLCDLDEGCIEPTNLAAEVNSPTSGTFSWSAVPQAQSYRFQYRPIGGGGVSMDVTENEVPLTGLPQGSTIQWRVRALCDGENSAFVIGPALNLAVPGTTWAELSGGDEEYQNFSTPAQEASGNPFKLFPNPVQDKAYLVFEQPFSGVVTVSSILGQQLYRITADSQKQLELDLSDWKSSHQLLLITVADGHSAPVTKRVLVAR